MIRDRVRGGMRALRRPSILLPRLTRRNWAFDVALALGLALLAIASSDSDEPGRPASFYPSSAWPGGSGAPVRPDAPPAPGQIQTVDVGPQTHQLGWSLLMLLVVVPLIFRRRYPLSMLWVVLATAPFTQEDHATLQLSFYVCVFAAYSAAVYSPYRIPALASLPVAALLYMQLQGGLQDSTRGPAVTTVPRDVVPFLILVPIAIAADGLRRWKRRADEEREQVTALRLEQADAERRAAEQERARIARELHDVVTHNVSVMVIQAGAARKVLEATGGTAASSSSKAREALLAVEASGRSAMTELRHAMGLLTMDGDKPELAPQPGLADLESLVEKVRGAGLPVQVTVVGQRGHLPEGVDLAAYRVVQEALTNAVKHAGGASAAVRVEHGEDSLRVEVTDTGGRSSLNGQGLRGEGLRGEGRGLVGLRQRLALYGGELRTGPRVRGGFRVEAVFPLTAAEAQAP